MKKDKFTKIALILCSIAAVISIGSAVSGWKSDKDTEKDTGTETAAVCVIDA
jgi:hypothetical protein